MIGGNGIAGLGGGVGGRALRGRPLLLPTGLLMATVVDCAPTRCCFDRPLIPGDLGTPPGSRAGVERSGPKVTIPKAAILARVAALSPLEESSAALGSKY